MAKVKINIGDPVEIVLADQSGEAKPYLSMVGDVKNENTVIINTPAASDGGYIQLPQREKCTVRFISPRGIIQYRAYTSRDTSEGAMRFTELKLAGEGERIQQRNFFRLQFSNTIYFQIRVEDDEGVMFLGLSEREREKIIIYLHHLQLKLVQ